MAGIRIKALILDYGGVLSEPHDHETLHSVFQRLIPDCGDFIDVYRSKRARYDCGQITGEQYWRSIFNHYGLRPNGPEIARLIREDVRSWARVNESMIKLLVNDRGRVNRLAIVSNMTWDFLAFMRKHFEWLDLFDELVFSCEVGKSKPDIEIYEVCLKNLRLSPPECLFVDDSAENVRSARETRMQAIHFKTFPEYIRELDEKYILTR